MSMLQFQPPGFGQQVIETSLGQITYYTPTHSPWLTSRHWTPLVFLHSLGGGSSAYEWSRVYPAFAADYRVIAPDLVGWGASDHPARDYQVFDYLIMLQEVLQQTRATPAIVFASSLTAGLVVRLAIQQPELFRALVLVCPSGYSDFDNPYQQGIPAQLAGTPGIDRLIYALGAANELAVRNFMQQFLFAQPGRVTQEMVMAYLASAQRPNAEYAALASLKGNLCFDLALYLSQLQVRTIMLWGEQARFSSVKTGQRLASLNPEAVKAFHVISNAGVLPHLEVPEMLVGVVQPYLAELR